VKLHYENASGENGVTDFCYDENGIMQRSFWTLIDGSRSSMNYHAYDRGGRIILKYREFSDGLTSTNTYSYDDQGNLLVDMYERSDGRRGKVFYAYDDRYRQIEADCQGLNGWFFGTIRYSYDSNSRKTGAVITRDGKAAGNIGFEYDDQGNMVREYWDLNGSWSQTFTFEYQYCSDLPQASFPSSNVFVRNTGAYRLVAERYDFAGRSGGPSRFDYDREGRLIKKVFESSAGFRTDTVYSYGNEGLLASSRREYSDGRTGVFSYEFDGNRRLVRRVFERSDGLRGLEAYEYDQKGNLAKGKYVNFDGWLTGDLAFESDSSGNLVSGRFEGEKYHADIDFDVDEAGNVVRIHWAFDHDAGMTQTYIFEYEKLERGVSCNLPPLKGISSKG